MFRSQRQLMISEPDLSAALNHLNSLPLTITRGMVEAWGKKQVREWIVESIPEKLDYGTCFNVGTGVWAHVVPMGYGLKVPDRNKLPDAFQIVISIRSVGTDVDNLLPLTMSESN